MLTVGDVLTKTLAKSQKIIFWSQKNSFKCFFFLLTVGNALKNNILKGTKNVLGDSILGTCDKNDLLKQLPKKCYIPKKISL